MFSITYIRRELARRRGRTVVTVLGLALGVGLVCAITSVSRGLDRAQRDVLNPLASVGTDLVVTRPVEPGKPGSGPRRLGNAEARALARENASVLTDLSKLGKPGEKFERVSFMPGTQLTFPASEASKIAALAGVEAVGSALVLTAVHQKGTIPNVVADFVVGGEEVTIEVAPPSPEKRRRIAGCLRGAQRRGESGEECLGGSVQQKFVTPRQRVRRSLGAPNTDIQSDTYSIAGVDRRRGAIALITPAQLSEGRFLRSTSDAVVAEAYADRKGLSVGSKLRINDKTFTVAGLVKPALGGQSADVYVDLGVLQQASGRKARVNVVLVRAQRSDEVGLVSSSIEQTVVGARVSDASDIAETVSGSLVDAAALSDRLGTVLSIALLASAFLIATLLTLGAVAKRIRELGTLKAIGWSDRRVVRQVLGESVAQGVLGGLLGTAVGVGAAIAIGSALPALQATAAAGPAMPGPFGLGDVASSSEIVRVRAVIDATTIGIAVGLAILGGLVAGGAGALRASRLRPADALRQVG